jgi:hypothetical protein
MLDKFLVLLERFVVAHELIAANSARRTVTETVGNMSVSITEPKELEGTGVGNKAVKSHKELPVEGEEVIDTPPAKSKSKPAPADDLDDDEPEEKPVKKTRGPSKPKEEPKGPDLSGLRDDIKQMAKAIAAGDSDECADHFDELLEDFKVRTVTKLPDEDVEEFHKEASALVAKYYEVEED